MKKIRNLTLLLLLVVLTATVSFQIGRTRPIAGANQTNGNLLDLSMMWKVKNRLQQLYLEKDKINDQEMVQGAIVGMVASLGDPYTVYLPAKENKSANEDLAGEFGGVGISLGFKDKNLAVMTPLPKTPAEKAGLLAGDLILKITDKLKKVDKDTMGISLNEAVDLIRGKIGTEVTLKIYREGKKEAFEVTLKRENIVVPSMEVEYKEKQGKKVAWVKLYKFSEQLYKDWGKTVDSILAEKKKIGEDKFGGIVLDLRNNPGGFLQASVLVASDFLKDGVVVSQESSNGSKEDYKVDKSMSRLSSEKLVVLVNGGSASAAEILAGALKEYKRATLVGEKTFGKGTVQQPEDFSDGSGLHVTIAKWLLPNGKNIHKVGVDPDVVVKYVAPAEINLTPTPTSNGSKLEIPDNQLDKAIEVLLKT